MRKCIGVNPVQEYTLALYRFAYYQLGDATAAEDLVSEVVVRVIGRVGEFVLEQATFRAWLFRIARNLIVEYSIHIRGGWGLGDVLPGGRA